ncbi:M48 family metallopeptidase [Haloimpatiens sp. FM7330]|uniref:M48 family metallopeptidase n=1 Tax=Haloimpatiens sp. FM7330 TaxID=3298610 RepID=UPI00363F5C79
MNLNFKYENTLIEFEIKRSKRKTLQIQIDPTGNILVKVPQKISQNRIIELVQSKQKWIIKNLNKIKQIDFESIKKKFVQGEKFLYLGNEYLLKIEKNNNVKIPVIQLNENKLYIESNCESDEVISKYLIKWYKKMAQKIISERVKYYQKYFIEKPKLVKAKEQKRRWGTCTGINNLYFNWRIIMAPIEVIDYVVVHEMSHMPHKNHSKEFWNEVESILPQYKEQKKWLKENGIMLDV